MNEATPDTQPQEFVSHLEALLSGTTAPDAALVGAMSSYTYSPGFRANEVICSPAIQQTVQLLLQVSTFAPEEYTLLLEEILRHMPISQISGQIPRDVMLGNINGPFLDILRTKLRTSEPSEFVEFAEGNEIVSCLLDVLFQPSTRSQMAFKITQFLESYYSRCEVPQAKDFWRNRIQQADFCAEKWAFASAEAFYSYMELLGVLNRCKVDQATMERALDFDVARAFENPLETEFVLTVLVDFLAPYVESHDSGQNSAKIVDFLLHRYAMYTELGETSHIVSSAYTRLVQAMLHGVSHRAHALRFLQEHPPKVDLSSPEGARQFCVVDLAFFGDAEAVFRQNFAARSVECVPEPVAFAILHLISDERFFSLLVQSGNFGQRNLESLPHDLWLEAVLALAKHDHSVQYMFDVPGLIPKLLSIDRTANQHAVEMKAAILRRLEPKTGDIDMGSHTNAVLRQIQRR